jgi:hypothetical protein
VWAIMTELNGGLEVFGVRLAAVTGARNRSAALAAWASSAATRSRHQGVTRSGMRVQEMGGLNDTATAGAMLAMSRRHRRLDSRNPEARDMTMIAHVSVR